MEPKWVLTSVQKEVRFRKLFKERNLTKVDATNTNEKTSDVSENTRKKLKHEQLLNLPSPESLTSLIQLFSPDTANDGKRELISPKIV